MTEAQEIISVEPLPEILNRNKTPENKIVSEGIQTMLFFILLTSFSKQRVHLQNKIRIEAEVPTPELGCIIYQ